MWAVEPNITTTIAGLILAVLVIFITSIDLQRMIIPDMLNAALASGGLAYVWLVKGDVPLDTIVGAIGLFALFYCVRLFHSKLRNTVGLGLGDVKMAGAAALWLEPINLPIFLFIASATAIAGMIVVQTRSGGVLQTRRLPFGPFLGLALLIVWFSEQTDIQRFLPFIWFG